MHFHSLAIFVASLLLVQAPTRAESVADVEPIPIPELVRLTKTRTVKIDERIKDAVASFAKTLPPESEKRILAMKIIGDDETSCSFQDFASLMRPGKDPAMAMSFKDHSDPVLRFLAYLSLAATGDKDASDALYSLIHDHSLTLEDKRIIRTFCDGWGIRASTDTSEQMQRYIVFMISENTKLKRGVVAPKFRLKSLTGEELDSDELRGRVIVLHFWATTCGPCMAQMTSHVETLAKYDSKDVAIIFVNRDEDEDAYKNALKKHHIPFYCVRERTNADFVIDYGAKILPMDVVIDAHGKVFANSIEDIPSAIANNRHSK